MSLCVCENRDGWLVAWGLCGCMLIGFSAVRHSRGVGSTWHIRRAGTRHCCDATLRRRVYWCIAELGGMHLLWGSYTWSACLANCMHVHACRGLVLLLLLVALSYPVTAPGNCTR